MAEFNEVTRQWKRMCNKYFDGKNWVCNKACPMYVFEVCSKPTVKYPVPLEVGQDLAHEIDCVIMSWAADHPEPVYPTWWKYLCMIGVIPDELGDKTLGEMTVYSLMNTYIQSDIAQKLEIEPKEG